MFHFIVNNSIRRFDDTHQVPIYRKFSLCHKTMYLGLLLRFTLFHSW